MSKIITPAYFIGGSEVATNSLDIDSERLVSIKSGFVDKAVIGDKVEGLSVETKVFDADNQTVKGAKLEFVRLGDDTVVEVALGDGTITQANVGAQYNLDANGLIDGSPTGGEDQLTLRKVVTSTLGQFVRNK